MAEVLNGSALEATLEIREVTTTLPELREIIVDSLVGMLRYIHQAQEEKRILLALGP